MAFTAKSQFGNDITTTKPGETVKVQLVEVTDRQGNNPSNRIDVRVHASNDQTGWAGSTKAGFGLMSVDDIRELSDTLWAAADHIDSNSIVLGAPPVKRAPAAGSTVPKVPVVKRGVAAKRAAARKAPAAKK